jgi:hypothetical protein
VRTTAYALSIVIGALLIIGGIATWIVVSTTLADQKITVSDDASCLAGDEVDGPFSAYCQAKVIDKHALEATGGLRYAQLDQKDPKRETAMTASFLQASLFTSVVAFGVAAMAIAIGVLFILIGLGIRDQQPDEGPRQSHPCDRMRTAGPLALVPGGGRGQARKGGRGAVRLGPALPNIPSRATAPDPSGSAEGRRSGTPRL